MIHILKSWPYSTFFYGRDVLPVRDHDVRVIELVSVVATTMIFNEPQHVGTSVQSNLHNNVPIHLQ